MQDGNPKDHAGRAEDLGKKASETATKHEGNRVSADENEPQPTREPTRDQQK